MLNPRRQRASTITVTAPVGGWNSRDPLAQMKPTDAVVLDNWFCTPTELISRKGYSDWATGIPGSVQSLIDYDSYNGTEQLFAVSNDAGTCAIYDATAQGAVGATVVSGLTNAKWAHAQFATSGGSFLLTVNGLDNLRIYDGTTWYEVTAVSSPYAITGVATTLLKDVHTHKRRNWFIQKESLICWYLDTDAISGAAAVFDFGPIFEQGGSISQITTWSLDGGYGMDDYFVVVTSAGQVGVYKGNDPADPNNWSLVGVYLVGSPVGERSTCKYGGDVLLLNKDGLIPLSKALMSSRVSTHLMITDKIQNQLAEDTTTYASNYGWDVLLYPPQNILLVNIPISATESYQYVMNTISGGWARWTNIPAQCWFFANENLYFGTAGKVCKAWDTQADNGAPIVTDLLPAFSSFGASSRVKRFTMALVSMGYTNPFGFSSQMNLDFDQESTPVIPTTNVTPQSGVWDLTKWDQASWSTNIIPYTRWQLATGIGHYGALRVSTSSIAADIRYYATDYVFEPGGIL